VTYSESFPKTITQVEALREIKAHNVSPVEFFEEYGNHDTYQSADLLGWLGY
jgi:hypothetical protein